MADYNLKAEITADTSGYESGVKRAEKASKNLSKSISGVIQGLGKNGLVGALGAVGLAGSGLSATLGTVVKVTRQISKTIGECTDAYKKQVIAERQLKTAVNNNPFLTGESVNSLKEFASEMQKVSNYGDEELIPMMANLVSLGRTEDETMKIMKVALDMSASGTMSLDTAINQLNATLNGNIGRLGQQNAELKNLTEEELKSGKAVDILGEKFKGLASATLDTSKQLKNIKGDFKEAIGEFSLPSSDMWNKFWSGFYTKGIEVINKFNDYLDTSIIGKQIVENLSMNAFSVSVSTGVDIESVLSDFRYLKEQINYLSDSEIQTLIKTLEKQNKRTESEERMLTVTKQIVQSRKLQLDQDKKDAEEKAKAAKEAQKQAEYEKSIVALKQKHLAKLKEQEAKWENIKKVTGEEIKLEEKLKFYQDDLVAIMTESGGLITENNQYYKDQKKIIENLIKLIKEQGGEVVEEEKEIIEITAKSTTQFDKFFSNLKEQSEDWASVFSDIATTLQDSFGQVFTTLGENLVGAGNGFEDFAGVALNALAQVLSSLGAQLAAIAAVKAMAYSYGEAVAAMAASAAAFTAAGVASGLANKMQAIADAVEGMTGRVKNAKIALEELKLSFEELLGVFDKKSSSIFKTRAEAKDLLVELQGVAEQNKKAWEDAKKEADDFYEKYLKAAEFTSSGKTYIHFGNAVIKANYNEWLEMLEEANALEDIYNQTLTQIAEQQEFIDSLLDSVIDSYKEQSKAVDNIVASYKELYAGAFYFQGFKSAQVVIQEQLTNIKKTIQSIYEDIAMSGKELGTTLVSSIIAGATQKDFLIQMKDYIRTNLIKLAVYTEEFQNKLASIGTKITSALLSDNNKETYIKKLRKELEQLWNEASAKAQTAEIIIADVFGDLNEVIEDTTENIETALDDVEEKLSTFEEAMQSFKETISDLGGSLADELINGISEGLNSGEFLNNMKTWIRKMLIQSVVYTESMKSEIEAIGQAISKGISEGFTETSFHEIRRDLSWVFNQANQTIEGIDNILNSVFGGGYATGTNNATSGLHLVGEAGPELVKFRGGEQVLNAADTNKALSGMGKTINQNITFNNLQDTTAYAMMNQLKQYNRQLAINGVL